MFKHLAAAAAALAFAATASADSWNSNQNIDRAMDAALATYRAKGAAGMVDESRNCYAGLDTSLRNKNVGRDVEYCIAYEFSVFFIDREASKAAESPSATGLNFNDVLLRAFATLEQAKIVRRPEEFEPYILRMKKVPDDLPKKM